jgi:hypothetical protein
LSPCAPFAAIFLRFRPEVPTVMAEPTALWHDSATTLPATESPPPSAVPADPLEQRVYRLETAVSALQDTQALEDRLVERVSDRLQSKVAIEAERLSAAERRTAATAVMAAAGKAYRAVVPLGAAPGQHASFLVIDLFVEAVAIFRMFFDFTYKVAWSTRILVVVLLLAILTSHWWLPGTQIDIIGRYLDKLVDLVLAFILYKALSREAQRYLQTRPS